MRGVGGWAWGGGWACGWVGGWVGAGRLAPPPCCPPAHPHTRHPPHAHHTPTRTPRFEYPSTWKSEAVNKVQKGTQGIDCRVRACVRARGSLCERGSVCARMWCCVLRVCVWGAVQQSLPPPTPDLPPTHPTHPDHQPPQPAADGVCHHAGARGGGRTLLPPDRHRLYVCWVCGGRLRHAGGCCVCVCLLVCLCG